VSTKDIVNDINIGRVIDVRFLPRAKETAIVLATRDFVVLTPEMTIYGGPAVAVEDCVSVT